jgi:Zn-dependent peptidase ImmA (M78 family)/DNA-binding XRE family transcriptional regulator
MITAHINGKMLTWARTRAGFEQDRLAKGPVSTKKIKAWENGEEHPTQNQAMALAEKLGISYAMLFMPTVPAPDDPQIPDLRTIGGKRVKNPSLAFREVLNSTLVRQDWIRDERKDRGAKPLKFVGRFTVDNDPKKVAADMRGTLELSSTDRAQCPDYEAFIKHLVSRAEGLGILVMRSALVGHDTHRKLDVNEFRGFALNDPFAPVVFINDTDAKAAQVFTIAHEMVHIWIGEDGVSDRTPNQEKESANKIELFCDLVAAELLVPEAEFNKVWKDGPVKAAAQATARYFRVSTLVALRRAKELSRISFDSFMNAVNEEYDRYRTLDQKKRDKQKEKDSQGGNFWASFDIRNGKVLNTSVAEAVAANRTSFTEASTLLGVSIASTIRYMRRTGLK